MKWKTLLCVFGASYFQVQCQTELPIWSFNPVEKAFKHLLLNNATIALNDTIHEEITDLVQVNITNSILPRRREHHQVFLLGWMAHAFGGFNWRALHSEKQKFVGTISNFKTSHKERFTEYDIIFDIIFYQKKYLQKIFYAYDCQRKIHRQDIKKRSKRNYNAPPFIRDTLQIDNSLYRLHCELTPPRAFRPQLHYLFFPTYPRSNLTNHINFQDAHPAIGFYGAWCLDCNHTCHPEIHPYEVVWWLKANQEDPTDIKTWHIGVIREASNRFPKWSSSPLAATVSIPFAFRSDMGDEESFKIKAEHLVFDEFNEPEFRKLKIPAEAFGSEERYHMFHLVAGARIYKVEVILNNILQTRALRFWFSDLNYDPAQDIISGYFNLAVSVNQLYTTRISFGKTLWD